MAEQDTARIKRNIAKMIDQGAPETDIDAYVASEGTTPDALRGGSSKKQDDSYAGSLTQGVSDVFSGVGKTVKNFGAPELGAAIEQKGKGIAPANQKSATEDFMNRGGAWYDKNWSAAPRALVENAPALTTDVLAGLAAKKLGGKTAAALGSGLSYLLRTRGEAAEGRAAARTGDPNAEPSTEDKVISAASGVPEAALAAVGAGRFVNPAKIAGTGVRGAIEAGGKLAATAGIEGGVGAGQDVIGQVAQTAGTPGGTRVDPGQVFGAGVLSAGTGAGMASIHAGSDLNNARRFRGFENEASQSVANRIQANADGDLGNVKTARKAVGATETDIKSDLSQAFSADPNAKALIDSNEAARRALARFNAGEHVTETDLGHIADATSGSPASDRISSLTREMTALRKLKEMGNYTDTSFKGGLSNKMEQGVRAIYNPVGAATGAGLAAAGLSQPAMAAGVLSSAPAAVAGSVGGYALARALDKATGYRSPADTFVKKFGGTATTTPAIVKAPEQPRPGPTGPSIPLANTFNGKAIEPPWGVNQQASVTDLAKRDNRLSKAVDTALTRGVDQQNREDARQETSIDRGADLIGRGGVAQIRGDQRVQALKARADDMAERQGLRELKQDAQGLVASRTATTKLQQQDATQTVQARRANDAMEKRGVTEMKQDAQGLMASRQSPNTLDRAQMGDARELMAARRAHEKLQAQQDAAETEASHAKSAIGSDNAVSPDTMKQAQKLIKSLAAVQKIKDRVEKSTAQLEKKQASMAKTQERAQAKAERDVVKEAKAKVKADKPAPKSNGKTNGHDKPKTLDDYPEAPWAYETPKVAAQMAHDYAKAQGTDITSPEGYKRGAAKRIEATRDVFADISKEVPKTELPNVEVALNKMLGVRNESDAKNFREALKAAMPEATPAIDKHLTDAWIRSTWTPQRSRLH
jgi:hypothetical protein